MVYFNTNECLGSFIWLNLQLGRINNLTVNPDWLFFYLYFFPALRYQIKIAIEAIEHCLGTHVKSQHFGSSILSTIYAICFQIIMESVMRTSCHT